MSKGVPVLNQVTLPCRTRKTGPQSFNIILVQGLNRQIRRMCEYLGYRVTSLRRIRIMNIQLGRMRPGSFRNLTAGELSALQNTLNGTPARGGRG